MDGLLATLAGIQAIGAIVGAGGAVLGETFYLRALIDGRIDHAERDHLRVVGRTLSFGMFLVLVGSIGLVIVNFQNNLGPQPALSSPYWTLMALVFATLWAPWAIARKQISFLFGSAVIFTAWWYIAFLTLGKLPLMTFGASIALYVVTTVIIAGILTCARMMVTKSST